MVNGFEYHPEFLARSEQAALVSEIAEAAERASTYVAKMPRTGRPMSVDMLSFGAFGWYSDKAGGYRYEPRHPETGVDWPPIPDAALATWRHFLSDWPEPDSCLANFYRAPKAKMGLHQDRDEEALEVPVLSISLGDTGVFRLGGTARKDPTRSLKLASGDVVILGGEARLAYHGIDRVMIGSSTVVPGGGRLNLTLRRVRPI
ncbi:MAG: alpha-ketoglutarate-dependent dioxygenase AlkB [Pseudomonadota bacterium]